MASGKGGNCPNCGENTFHKNGGVRRCSKCGTVGWLEDGPGGPGGGRGAKCGHCDKHTLHTLYVGDGLTLRHCSSCGSMAISN